MKKKNISNQNKMTFYGEFPNKHQTKIILEHSNKHQEHFIQAQSERKL